MKFKKIKNGSYRKLNLLEQTAEWIKEHVTELLVGLFVVIWLLGTCVFIGLCG